VIHPLQTDSNPISKRFIMESGWAAYPNPTSSSDFEAGATFTGAGFKIATSTLRQTTIEASQQLALAVDFIQRPDVFIIDPDIVNYFTMGIVTVEFEVSFRVPTFVRPIPVGRRKLKFKNK